MKYYIIAGEASGDLHGSNLMKGIYAEDPQADIRFWGGDLMKSVWSAFSNDPSQTSLGPSPYPGVGKCPLHTSDPSSNCDLPMVKVPAAWLIEQCGWKGKRSGNAAVYDKQPLVIVNYTGEAYPEEIIGLEKRIIASVKAKFDIELHPEVDHI